MSNFLPILEEEIGVAIGRLIERAVSQMKEDLGWDDMTSKPGHWLLQTVFWLVSGKIIDDKNVGKFKDLDLANSNKYSASLCDATAPRRSRPDREKNRSYHLVC